jgi:hypothetical protein
MHYVLRATIKSQMEQHPIPQQISSYQFRLVGDMTLKQFFQIGGGALVSLLIYASGVHPIVKWPLIIFSFSLGAALAFLPLEERPLSRWIFSFFRSVYSPTVYLWQKKQGGYVYFQEEAAMPKDESIIAPHGEAALEQYLNTKPEDRAGLLNKFEETEKGFLARLSSLFALPKPAQQTPSAAATKSSEAKKAQATAIPPSHPVQIASKSFRPRIVVEEKAVPEIAKQTIISTSTVSPTFKNTDIQTRAAQFSAQAAPPNPPTIPNTITGQVLDSNNKIIESAILEIRDLAGRPVRALRSNKVGHFIIVTALQNGQYDIITEKEGYEFDPLTFEAKGDIIPPILIKAKNSLEAQNN